MREGTRWLVLGVAAVHVLGLLNQRPVPWSGALTMSAVLAFAWFSHPVPVAARDLRHRLMLTGLAALTTLAWLIDARADGLGWPLGLERPSGGWLAVPEAILLCVGLCLAVAVLGPAGRRWSRGAAIGTGAVALVVLTVVSLPLWFWVDDDYELIGVLVATLPLDAAILLGVVIACRATKRPTTPSTATNSSTTPSSATNSGKTPSSATNGGAANGGATGPARTSRAVKSPAAAGPARSSAFAAVALVLLAIPVVWSRASDPQFEVERPPVGDSSLTTYDVDGRLRSQAGLPLRFCTIDGNGRAIPCPSDMVPLNSDRAAAVFAYTTTDADADVIPVDRPQLWSGDFWSRSFSWSQVGLGLIGMVFVAALLTFVTAGETQPLPTNGWTR